jgi:hypothetical protein
MLKLGSQPEGTKGGNTGRREQHHGGYAPDASVMRRSGPKQQNTYQEDRGQLELGEKPHGIRVHGGLPHCWQQHTAMASSREM